jgi:hypothetical protein
MYFAWMEYSRLPRFKRAVAVTPLQITKRDREILRQVQRYRFLRSPQIAALLADRSQQLLRRLQFLFHHGYMERPRAQLDYYHQGGSRHLVYGLGSKGAALLKQEGRWGEKNRAVGRIFLEHALLVSDVMVALELACRNAEVRLLTEEELSRGDGRSFHWQVNLQGRAVGIVPDRVFALEFPTPGGKRERAYLFLEADRGTMPVNRKNLLQTSFLRKLLAYEATWAQSIHRTRFGFHRFRVLTVTTSTVRVQSLVQACAAVARGRGLFLFADRSVLERPELLFGKLWQTGNPDETASILD